MTEHKDDGHPPSDAARIKPGRRRHSGRRAFFLFTFVFVMSAGALIQLTIYLLNSSMHMEIGRCCKAYDLWEIVNLQNVILYTAFAAALGGIATYTLV
jgi:hypothetical protein